MVTTDELDLNKEEVSLALRRLATMKQLQETSTPKMDSEYARATSTHSDRNQTNG